MLEHLERLVPLAPLHQPNNLAPIREIRARRPEMPQVACFDTAFHRGHPEVADRYAIADSCYQEGVRRYGFHGLSYEYIADRLREVDPALAQGRVVVCHLGSGASLCAIHAGRSIDSTMGFTAVDGLPMGTRTGQLDPGVVLYLLQAKGFDAERIERFLYHDGGLKGLSGVSNDVRDLLASAEPGAVLALDYFVYRIVREAGALAAAMEGIDGIVFTAGVGEHSPDIRAAGDRAAGLAWRRARPRRQRAARAADLDRDQPSQGLCRPDRRGTDDRPPHPRPAAGPRGSGLARMGERTGMTTLDRALVTLEGRRGLVTGIANDQSIAWGCAKAFRGLGRGTGRHLPQREGQAARRAPGPAARGRADGTARPASGRRARGAVRADHRASGAGSISSSTPSRSRRWTTCRAAWSTAPRRASSRPWRSPAGPSSAWPSWPSR